MPVISELGRLRQKNHEFETNLGYVETVSNCFQFCFVLFCFVCQANKGRRRSGGLWLKASLGRKFWKPHLNQWLGAMVHTYHPSYSGKYKQELYAQASLSIKQDPISKVTNTAVLYLFLLFCFFFFFMWNWGLKSGSTP
jgi:hypothetical protein